jgi:hypothetical protein
MIFGIIIREDFSVSVTLLKLKDLMSKENSILRCAITLSLRLLVSLLRT